MWRVKLERGVWLAPWDGDPGRTMVKANARRFTSRDEAEVAMRGAQKQRGFGRAKVERAR